MRDIYFISDTHFDHANILKFQDEHGKHFRGDLFGSVEEMNEEMENGARIVDFDVSANLETGELFIDLTIQPAPYYVITFTIPESS